MSTTEIEGESFALNQSLAQGNNRLPGIQEDIIFDDHIRGLALNKKGVDKKTSNTHIVIKIILYCVIISYILIIPTFDIP